MAGSSYIAGDPWTICDSCGWKIRRSMIRKSWDGFMLCDKDWEPKHEQLYPTPIIRNEGRSLPNARPEKPDRFIEVGEVTEDDF